VTTRNTATAGATHANIVDALVSKQSLDLTLFVSEKLCYFAGHFPGFAILPGVVQLAWAVNYAREYLAKAEAVIRVERLKFTCPIQPNTEIILSIALDPGGKFANFSYLSTKQGRVEPFTFSQGRLIYG
jgi:3-hydroxymyristoyl/3-hydroxydecanoyl-(acyl carrier protein) dehydratase